MTAERDQSARAEHRKAQVREKVLNCKYCTKGKKIIQK